MKITGPNSAQSTGAAKGKGAARGGGFTLGGASEGAEASGVTRTSGVAGTPSLDALLALQSVEDPLQRRRRAVSRAGRILDALDGLKLSLLDGAVTPGALQSLMTAVREERAATDDPRLQDLLNDIETRAAVELAKLGDAVAA